MKSTHKMFAGAVALAVAPLAAAQDGHAKTPSTAEIVGKAIEAMGGMDALADKESLAHHTKMVFGEMVFDATVQWRFPLQLRVDVVVPEQGEAVMGSDGEHVWTRDPGSDSYDVDEPEALVFSVALSPYASFGVTMMHYSDDLEYDKLVEFGGEKCHRVEVDGKHGATVEALYFNAASGKPAGLSVEGPDGGEVMIIFKEWEVVDGVNMVISASFMIMDQPIELTFSDFAWNKVDDEALKMPEAVSKIIAERKKQEEVGENGDDGDNDDDDDQAR